MPVPQFKNLGFPGENQNNKKRYQQEPSMSNMDMTTTTADMNQTGFNNTLATNTMNRSKKTRGKVDMLDETDPDLNYALQVAK